MELKTYRAPTMHEALAMVRRDLGTDAAMSIPAKSNPAASSAWCADHGRSKSRLRAT